MVSGVPTLFFDHLAIGRRGLNAICNESCTLCGLAVARFDKSRRMVMKIIFSALLAVSVLAGIASSASAFDADKFWKEHATSGER
jgi:hypothetical protein